jgi:addiction module HigA family antidote
MNDPPHSGDFIRTEIIKPVGLSVTVAAAALQVSRPALSSLLNGNADLSGDMSHRIEKAFRARVDTLMRMQVLYDTAQTRKREKQSMRGGYTRELQFAAEDHRTKTAAISVIFDRKTYLLR